MGLLRKERDYITCLIAWRQRQHFSFHKTGILKSLSPSLPTHTHPHTHMHTPSSPSTMFLPPLHFCLSLLSSLASSLIKSASLFWMAVLTPILIRPVHSDDPLQELLSHFQRGANWVLRFILSQQASPSQPTGLSSSLMSSWLGEGGSQMVQSLRALMEGQWEGRYHKYV